MSGKDFGPWLSALQVLLAPMEPRGLALLDGEFPGDDMNRIDALPGRSRIGASTEGFRPGPAWLVRLPCNERSGQHALLIDGGDGLDPAAPLAVMARLLCRSAWRVRFPPGNLLASCDESRQALHDLRNGLNSVVMSSAVIGGAALPENLKGIVHDLESAGRRSLRALTELSSVVSR
jgi:hypothetical protein